MSSFAGKLKDKITWSLGRNRPFNINDEYTLELLYVNPDSGTAKIKVTNLKNKQPLEKKDSKGEYIQRQTD